MWEDLNGRQVLQHSLMSESQLDTVVNYIKNQEVHHTRMTFREEYLAFLKRFNVPYNPKYVFDPDDHTEE